MSATLTLALGTGIKYKRDSSKTAIAPCWGDGDGCLESVNHYIKQFSAVRLARILVSTNYSPTNEIVWAKSYYPAN